jgi:hypothetical protein
MIKLATTLRYIYRFDHANLAEQDHQRTNGKKSNRQEVIAG